MENWKDVEGYEGLYQVSDKSNVRGLKSHACILKPLIMHGYQRVFLFKNGPKKSTSIHRLVAAAFIPNPDNKPYVNHKNLIRHDNRIENLEWCTHLENMAHASKAGVFKAAHPKKTNIAA